MLDAGARQKPVEFAIIETGKVSRPKMRRRDLAQEKRHEKARGGAVRSELWHW